jgi:hypothetical protein
MATRISKLKWDEISGVDHPANETPGWILQKAADEVEDFETAIVELHKSLGSDSVELFFKDADESVRKAVKKLVKHLDENLEEVDDDDDEDEEDVKKEKRGIAKLRDIFGLEKADDTTSSDDDDDTSDDETSDDEDDEDDTPDDEEKKDTDDDDTSDEDDETDEDEEKKPSDDDELDEDEDVEKSALTKSAVGEIISALEKELEPIREAVGALADRTESLEKHATGRTSILGQDGSEDEDDDDDERAGLHKAITSAIRTGDKVTLT